MSLPFSVVGQFEKKRGPYKRSSKGDLFSGRMAFMEWISRAIDKLPAWAKLTCVAFAVLGSVYCIARFGFWSFLLRVVFSP